MRLTLPRRRRGGVPARHWPRRRSRASPYNHGWCGHAPTNRDAFCSWPARCRSRVPAYRREVRLRGPPGRRGHEWPGEPLPGDPGTGRGPPDPTRGFRQRCCLGGHSAGQSAQLRRDSCPTRDDPGTPENRSRRSASLRSSCAHDSITFDPFLKNSQVRRETGGRFVGSP